MKTIMCLLAAMAVSACAEDAKGDNWFDHFRKDRRDPFTFALKPQIEAQPKPRQDDDFDVKEQNARNLLVRAENAVMEYRAADCIDACDRALNQLRHISDERPGVASLRQSLQSLRKAGDAMRLRAEAAAAYQRLNVSVTGVVTRPRKAQAIVNGAVVREGQTIAVTGNESLLVEKISSDKVVLNFRGFRMATALATAE
jgi:hypothetical protein